MEYQDYYKILDVPRGADEKEIRKAYRKLAQKFHPDVNKNKNAEDKLKEINEAYEVLKDPEKRKRYDALGANWQNGQQFRPPPGSEDIFSSFMGGNANFRGNFQSGGGGGWSDFFEALFGDGPSLGGSNKRSFAGKSADKTSAGRMRQRKGQSKRAEMTVTLEEVFHGTTKKIQIETITSDKSGAQDTAVKTYDVRIPPTIKDGATIRLAGLGEPGLGGGGNGDLLITINIAKHQNYKIDERDIVATLPITPWEAAFGGKIPFEFFGSTLALNIPAGSQSGQRLRLKGKGLAKDKTSSGDCLVELKIVVPKTLTDEERKLFEQLAKVSKFNPR